MDATKIGLTVILGVVAGILGGAMGTSGALTIIPGLLILELVPNFATAAGTTLLTILPPLSIGAIYAYYRNKEVQFDTAFILMVSYSLFAGVGAYITHTIKERHIYYIMSVYLVLIALFYLRMAMKSK